MDAAIGKSQECYHFPGIRGIFKKYKSFSTKHQQHDLDQFRRRHVPSKTKIKPGDDYKNNHHSFEEEFFKANNFDKKQDAKYMNKVNLNEKGVDDQLNKMSHKHNSRRNHNNSNNTNTNYNYEHHHNYNSCFKAFIFRSVPSKKKKGPSRVASFDPTKARMEPVEVEKKLKKSRSFDATASSFGRSSSMNNNRYEQRAMKPPTYSRSPSTINRATSFNGGNGSFSRNASISRPTNDASANNVRKANNLISKSGPIMFSNSSGMLNPPATEKQLECTLEELCHGCVKHIDVTRDVYTFSGQRIKVEEELTVNIKPGWKTGTKITFEGTIKDRRPGEYRGDIIFVIIEKGHPLFRRIDDDLELEIGIPLVDALTGCSLYIPLLGREKMFIEIDDIIYPGYKKILSGQGMPNQKNPQQKGDLIVRFLVDYPSNLTDEQRSEISNILNQ